MEISSQVEHLKNYCLSHLKQTAVPLLKVVKRKEKVNFLNVKDFEALILNVFSTSMSFLFPSHD